jgi:glycosyltransferase involved in cell wall biosynthesis
MKERVKSFLRNLHGRVNRALSKGPETPVVYNANAIDDLLDRKRALLVYLPKSFILEENHPAFLTHQNLKQCRQIAAVLGEFDYAVDVADKRSLRRLRDRRYDLIIADRADLREIDDSFSPDALKIFLATSMNYALHNKNVRARHELHSGRRKCKIQVRRPYPEAMPYLARSDAVVGFGNEFIMSTWSELFAGPIYPFNNYGFKDTGFVFDGKDFASARKHFLFFASRSQMQKGLDLLLEIFSKHPDLHLYICSQFDSEHDFCAAYRKELFNTPNIHPIGWIKVNGAMYDQLVRKCAYVIHPTCSEGQPGSVVQCMYSGLIPLVTKWAGIDTEDFGVTFDDSLEGLESALVKVSGLPGEWHRQRSIRTRRVAEARYSETAFMRRWRRMLADILGRAEAKSAGSSAIHPLTGQRSAAG